MTKIPFYRSEVFVTAVAAFFAQLAAVGDWPELLHGILAGQVEPLARASGLLLTALVAAYRAASRVQPLTLTAGAAAQHNGQTPPKGQAGRSTVAFLVALLACLTLPAAVILPGCSALGLAPARTPGQAYAYGLGQIEALNNAARIELEAGRLPLKSAEYVLSLTRQSRAFLEAAHTLADAGDIPGAQRQTELAIAILTQLQTFLNTRT